MNLMKIAMPVLIMIAAAVSLAGPIETLPVNAWYEVPNSHLNSVAPSGWAANVMDPWSSGAFDTKRNNLIIWGGGHGDYSGNEIYLFSLDSLKWTRASNPSNPPAVDVPYASDGGPCSRHTYDYIQYVPAVDRFCSFGGAGFYQTGQTGTNNLDAFNFDTKTWGQFAVVPSCGGNIGSISAVDGGTGYAWYHGTGGYSWAAHWNPVTNVWTAHGKIWNMEDLDYNHTAAIDSKRHKMVAVGAGTVLVWNLQPDTGYIYYSALTTTGATGITGGGNPGVEYDPKSDKIVAWRGGSNVFTLDMDTHVWTQYSGTGATPTAAAPNGTFGRFRYSPKSNVFVAVNTISQDVFIYRLTAGSGTKTETPAVRAGIAVEVSPNPFVGKTQVRLIIEGSKASSVKIMDINGREMADLTQALRQKSSVEWNPGALPAGIYFVSAKIGNRRITTRLLLQK